jgi:hypothetical protein
MKIRTRVAGAVAGTAMAGLTAFALGTATPAGAAQQTQTAKPTTSSVTPAQATSSQGWECWGDDCWWGEGWDDWGW